MIHILGWIGAFICLFTYFYSVKVNNPKVFHIGNIIGAIILVPVQIYLEVYFSAILSATFGIVGLLGFLKMRKLL